jgi:very-short-patch-repair endonuclease
LPRPTTQIPILDHTGQYLRTVDMGWEDFMVAAEYDGDQHRTDRHQYVKDLRVIPKLERRGWIILRVIKEDRSHEVIQRAWDAMVSRGWRPN